MKHCISCFQDHLKRDQYILFTAKISKLSISGKIIFLFTHLTLSSIIFYKEFFSYIVFRKKFTYKFSIYEIKKLKIDLIIAFLLPVDKSDDVQNLLADKYLKWKTVYGERSAMRLKIWHASCIIISHHSARIIKFLDGIAALFGVKWIKDVVTRFLS